MNNIVEFLDQKTKDLQNFTPVKFVSEKLNIPAMYVVLGGIVTTLFLLGTGLGGKLLTSVICYLYPAWMTFKALESPKQDDDIQWLTYWIVFTVFSICDEIINSCFLYLFMMGLYYPLKYLFLLWLFLPQFKGASYVYSKIVRPVLKKYESIIDSHLAPVNERIFANNKRN